MNTQKPNRKRKQDTDIAISLNRGDMTQKRRKSESRSPQPLDRGDAKRNKKLSKQELFNTTKPKKAKSLKISSDLVSRSTNTFAESVPNCFGYPFEINMDFSTEGSGDYRKRIKDRYTFRGFQKNGTESKSQCLRKDDNIRKVNYVIQYDGKHELPNQTHFELLQREKSKEPREVKKTERKTDRELVHKAISAVKIKPVTKTKEESSNLKKIESHERKKIRDGNRKNSQQQARQANPDTRPTSYRRPVIKTITAHNTRVFKAVTFVEEKQRKPLQINIPKDISQKKVPSKSRIPILVPVSTPDKPEKTPLVKRKGNDLTKRKKRVATRKTPSCKSIDSPATEVAKWAPESIDQHTMPYYEAWVNKTVTAISKYSKKDKAYMENSKVLRTLKELGMHPKSPNLVYDKIGDETYAGRIRVRQRRPNKM